ncbi:MAG TPA: thioredoxin domain-containing protein, partial [bacterium]
MQSLHEELIADSGQSPAPDGYNRLYLEKSPYLRQHADNPVDWYPWSDEAFARARDEDKPVFLSIGYSTCHWCHVMEHESFEDPEVARLMNEAFVCVKVDREERPDLDDVYMAVCQMMTGSGGWPLTVILTPDKKPFFAGTYFPRDTRLGRTGLLDLVPRLQQIWASRRAEALQSAEQFAAMLRTTATVPAALGTGWDPTILDNAYAGLARSFDERYGGFGQAPKFPAPHNLLFLLRYAQRSKDRSVLHMVEKTLEMMSLGGIFDHLGYGFHRYSTDERWLLPHFEKMLYDQALLALAYSEAYQASGTPLYRDTAQKIFAYVLKRMTHASGGFFSAEDADSEGEEGKYYLWRESEIQRLLTQAEADLFCRIYNVESVGNFNEPMSGLRTGENILHLNQPIEELARNFKIPEDSLRQLLQSARNRLLEERDRRIPPHKDTKILTDWNGLMIAALAKGAQVFDEPAYAQAASRAADFLWQHLRRKDGRLLHRSMDGQAGIPAYLDDYAFLIWGLIELYEATFDITHLQRALQLQQDLIAHFWDEPSGGFFFASDDAEELLVRRKEVYDGAIPSGNSAALLNLLRLGLITGKEEWEEKAQRLYAAFASAVERFPAGYTQLLCAVDFALGPSSEVVISGDLNSADAQAMIKAVRAPYIPNKVVLFRPDGDA